MQSPRCVVLRALGLGDLLTGVPALRALRRALPDHRIALAAPSVLRPLVELSGAVDELVATPDLPGRESVPWSGDPPALAVDLHGNGPASKAPLQRLRPERLVAFAGPGADGRWLDGPRWRADEHEVRRWCRLVGDSLGVPADPTDLLLPAPPEALPPGEGPIVVHPGAASGSRRWPAERFGEVAGRLRSLGPVVVTGSPGEVPLAEEVRRRAGLPADSVVAGRTGLRELAALVAGARLVVSGDTGVAHLASAYARPSVVLFGPIPPQWWGPPADGPHLALWKGGPGRPGGVGDPHADRVDERLLAITVDEVLDAALSALRPASRTPPPRTTGPSDASPPRAAAAATSRGAPGRG